MKLDLDSKIPLYYQLASILEKKIEDGYYKEGDKLPSERELCELYDVSRMTIRLSIEELSKQGLVRKAQGKGTYVSNRSVVQNLQNVYSFSRELEKQGKISSTKVIKINTNYADYNISNKLGIKIGDKVIYLERLRLAEDTAIMVEKTWLPYDTFKFLLDTDFNCVGLYKTLENKGYKINRAIEMFRATELEKGESELLNCNPGHYGLLVKRISYSDGKVVSYSKTVSKGDSFEFTVELKD
ncbi:GntR family transcriptional regulator [Helcococcus kunzii]|uniref:GntR family transcriptional regulator n=1 Tax=Helcococcus kunzii TaxID=40091 RepID=UPI001C96E340|nr:GntR family transcriptional regulator [Helcococcus kunzii]QZO76041.1 GntR family transcriptional regulator [Helcococcus kunzii]